MKKGEGNRPEADNGNDLEEKNSTPAYHGAGLAESRSDPKSKPLSVRLFLFVVRQTLNQERKNAVNHHK